MKSFSWQDVALRALFIGCGVVAAAIMITRGEVEALPAIAVGGSIGACLVRGAGAPKGDSD
ncbi:MAG TPA: hypothetical protein VMT00_10590 [Thermoanaerobaculia bacterium]|nr:hypothetical protein [Thermoanaerobaculia bacterium]